MIAQPLPHAAPSEVRSALLYREHDPLNFKHLATTLNLILQPTGLCFRIIHECPGKSAVLSCRKLHVAISTNEAALISDDMRIALQSLRAKPMKANLEQKFDAYQKAIEITVGTGAFPYGPQPTDPDAEELVPFLAQIVVNHLLNINPAEVVYWSGTNSLMSPKDFLRLINSDDDMPPPPPPSSGGTGRPEIVSLVDRDPRHSGLRREKQDEQDQRRLREVAPRPKQAPTFLANHLEASQPAHENDLIAHLRTRLEVAAEGPKTAFMVSAATLFVAPIIGILLLMYNFMAGAHLRRTAMVASIAAAVTFASDILDNRGEATASVPVVSSSQTAQL